MPRASIFTPCGQLRLSNAPSHCQQIYEQLQQLLSANAAANNQQFDFTSGEHLEAWVYATARGLGRHLYMLERAGNQVYPLRAIELLPLLELDFGLTPGPRDDVFTRQKAVAAAQLTAQGDNFANVVAGLKLLLDGSFIAYVPAPAVSSFPSNPGSAGVSKFADVRVPPKFLQLLDPVPTTNSNAWVGYKNLDTTAPPVALNPGETVIVQGENAQQCERVTVGATAYSTDGLNCTANTAPSGTSAWTKSTSYSTGQYVTPTDASNGFFFQATTTGTSGLTEPVWPQQFGVQVADASVNWIAAGAATAFNAAFGRSHDVGATVVSANFPYWWSTQRHSLIVVTVASVADKVMREKIGQFMRRVARGVSTWAIVESVPSGGAGSVGPLLVGDPMGAKTIGSFAYTVS